MRWNVQSCMGPGGPTGPQVPWIWRKTCQPEGRPCEGWWEVHNFCQQHIRSSIPCREGSKMLETHYTLGGACSMLAGGQAIALTWEALINLMLPSTSPAQGLELLRGVETDATPTSPARCRHRPASQQPVSVQLPAGLMDGSRNGERRGVARPQANLAPRADALQGLRQARAGVSVSWGTSITVSG